MACHYSEHPLSLLEEKVTPDKFVRLMKLYERDRWNEFVLELTAHLIHHHYTFISEELAAIYATKWMLFTGEYRVLQIIHDLVNMEHDNQKERIFSVYR